MKEKKNKVWVIISNILLVISVLIVSLRLIRNIFYFPFEVEGDSMNPTLKEGDYGYALKIDNPLKQVKRKDIVTLEATLNNETKILVKRVIGIPGDVIEFKDDESTEGFDALLYINNRYEPQSYISSEKIKATVDSELKIILDENSYFVLGDNRTNSIDSLKGLGYINKANVKGIIKAVLKNKNQLKIKFF